MSYFDPNLPEGPNNVRDSGAVELLEAEPLEQPKPKRVPSKHRHMKVDESVTPVLIEQIAKSLPAGVSADRAETLLLMRMGYSKRAFQRVIARVERWKRNRSGTGHRMPGHIKTMDTLVTVFTGCLAELAKPQAPEPTLVQKITKGAKKLATDFASEVKAQQA